MPISDDETAIIAHGGTSLTRSIGSSPSTSVYVDLAPELDACFIVKDSSGQKLAYVYFEDEPGRRSAAELLSRDAASSLIRRASFVSRRPNSPVGSRREQRRW
jgi:hypothetical protein